MVRIYVIANETDAPFLFESVSIGVTVFAISGCTTLGAYAALEIVTLCRNRINNDFSTRSTFANFFTGFSTSRCDGLYPITILMCRTRNGYCFCCTTYGTSANHFASLDAGRSFSLYPIAKAVLNGRNWKRITKTTNSTSTNFFTCFSTCGRSDYFPFTIGMSLCRNGSSFCLSTLRTGLCNITVLYTSCSLFFS